MLIISSHQSSGSDWHIEPLPMVARATVILGLVIYTYRKFRPIPIFKKYNCSYLPIKIFILEKFLYILSTLVPKNKMALKLPRYIVKYLVGFATIGKWGFSEASHLTGDKYLYSCYLRRYLLIFYSNHYLCRITHTQTTMIRENYQWIPLFLCILPHVGRQVHNLTI